MGSYVKSQGESDFTPLPPGTYVGRCYQVINLGLHAAGPWDPKNKHYLGFEIPAERVTWTDKAGIEQEGPAVIGSRYTSSLSPKATLRQQLESWRGALFTDEQLQKFDLFNLIGVPAMISVIHSEDGKFANITGLMRLPQGLVCASEELPQVAYDPEDSGALAAFALLSNRMQETVLKGQQVPDTPAPPPTHQPAPAHPAVPAHQVPPGHQMPRSAASMLPPNHHQPGTGADDFDDDIPF